ncbi:MAG TPA: hydrogenase accessory protein HypB [candidate division Zixibacteria bacterium]|nr:hydrogenase accessory protein HypB [candidate division Zixibacteria bacterium]
MCKECGCGEPERNEEIIPVAREILEENAHYALHNKEHLRKHGIVMFNFVGSPGAGKTTLLERTIPVLREEFKIAVIEGDLETQNDKERIDRLGVPCYQICTHGACHLDAKMVHHALHELDLDDSFDIVFVENVGNLVCPADFPLGEDFRVVVLSVPEGDDKPEKYPKIFHGSDAVVLTKIDLVPHLDFDVEKCRRGAYQVNPKAKFFEVSAKTGDGFQKYLDWIRWAAKTPF